MTSAGAAVLLDRDGSLADAVRGLACHPADHTLEGAGEDQTIQETTVGVDDGRASAAESPPF